MKSKLTIGLATYDDYDGVFFTIQSLRMHHKTNDVEFIVLDNNPSSSHGKEVKKFIETQVKGRYIPYTEKTSSFSKYEILKYASGEYYLGLDCHVLLVPDALDVILDYFNNNHDCKDIIQGPLLYDDMHHISTHFTPTWRGGMFGVWATDDEIIKNNIPVEIPMTGMGFFACKTANWPPINSSFKGFGGEEWYIQEKFRRNGGKCICIPQAKWLHRFTRPNGVPYVNSWEDRIWNYYVGWKELYDDQQHPMIVNIKSHFEEFLPGERIDQIRNRIYEI